jgi:twitching motility protein PilT
MAFTLENLTSLIKVAVKHGASDVHIRTGEAPCLRLRGELFPVQTKNFSRDDIKDIMGIIFQLEKSKKSLDEINEMDGGFDIRGVCRLRYNFFRYSKRFGLILRIVNKVIPTIKELGIAKITAKIATHKRGLILVTGATGSGKSTTLAAMINEINETRSAHVITLEDPIEYFHTQKKSRITQREIGQDTGDYSVALRAALRQDPDVILIGELRDPETVGIALKAAETGHAVFATVHTTNALTTIGRVIAMFPVEEQVEVRKRLADCLHATISQRMLKKADGNGIAIAQEIMIATPGVRECVRGDEPLERIVQIIMNGRGKSGNGSQSFDQHILDLYEDGVISKQTALESATSESDFMQKLIID